MSVVGIGHAGRRHAALSSVIIVMLAASFLLMSGNVAAFPNTYVRGYVKDSVGNPLNGASITIDVLKPDNSPRSTHDDSTDSSGFYSHPLEPFEWQVDDKIVVTAVYDSGQEDNYAMAKTGPVQWVNVTFGYVIPEMGSMAGLMVSGGAIAAVAVAVITTRRRP